jgi:hypothetical protein
MTGPRRLRLTRTQGQSRRRGYRLASWKSPSMLATWAEQMAAGSATRVWGRLGRPRFRGGLGAAVECWESASVSASASLGHATRAIRDCARSGRSGSGSQDGVSKTESTKAKSQEIVVDEARSLHMPRRDGLDAWLCQEGRRNPGVSRGGGRRTNKRRLD